MTSFEELTKGIYKDTRVKGFGPYAKKGFGVVERKSLSYPEIDIRWDDGSSTCLIGAEDLIASIRVLRDEWPDHPRTPLEVDSFDEPDAPRPAPSPSGAGPTSKSAPRAQADEDDVNEDEADLEDLLDIVTASSVKIRRVTYLWKGRAPLGAVTLMPGEEGIGKTTVGARIMADLTLGRLEGEFHGTPKDAIIIAPEDGIEDVMTPRLQEAGADLDRVHFVKARVSLDKSLGDVIVPRDLKRIGRAVKKWGVGLVWIDSLVTTLPDNMKSIAYKDTAKILRAVGQWAEEERVSVIAPWHLNKASGSDTAVRIMDSRAFRTAVRSMLLVVEDPDAPEGVTRGIVALDKANAGTLHVPALRYELGSAHYVVEEEDPETGFTRTVSATCGVAEWIGELEGDGREIARNALLPKLEREDNPRTWLHDYLKERGEVARSEVLSDADIAGFSEATMKRASRAIKVVSRPVNGQKPDGTPYRFAMWRLNGSEPRQSDHSLTPDPTGPTGEAERDPTGRVYRDEPQWGQSDHARVCDPTGAEGDPTGAEPPAPGATCPQCGGPNTETRHIAGRPCLSCYEKEGNAS